jgi:hypothetical protein
LFSVTSKFLVEDIIRLIEVMSILEKEHDASLPVEQPSQPARRRKQPSLLAISAIRELVTVEKRRGLQRF